MMQVSIYLALLRRKTKITCFMDGMDFHIK